MAHHQNGALMLMMQFAWWCMLGAKWFLLTRHRQRPAREEEALEKPRHTPDSHQTKQRISCLAKH